MFGAHKFGGNAQTISKNRFLHHTSFLWDFDSRNMELLAHPPKAPKYREVRRRAPAPGRATQTRVHSRRKRTWLLPLRSPAASAGASAHGLSVQTTDPVPGSRLLQGKTQRCAPPSPRRRQRRRSAEVTRTASSRSRSLRDAPPPAGALEEAGFAVEDVTLEEAEAAPAASTICGTSEVAV